MSKRKTVAGGYEDSSDGSNIEIVDNPNPASKRSKPAPYAPPRLISASKAFQFPGSRSSSGRSSAPPRHVSVSSSNRPTPAPEGTPAAPHTPGVRIDTDPEQSGNSASCPITKDALGSTQVDRPVGSHQASRPRSTLALERQINEMVDTLEKHTSTSEQRHKATDDTLARILATLDRITSTSTPTLGASPSASPSPPDLKPYLSNPAPTPELIAIISKVVSEARGRVGKRKGGADDNSCKEHVRTTFYRMLGIAASKEIRPFFEDQYGEPDTLPTQFVDPDTHYCRPYPHWKSPLTKQVAWVPTFILRFKSTIPKDQTDLANVLRSLSDEQIVVLLNDGPFKSAQAAWRDMKKTDAEIEAMRSSSRRYQRVDRKVASRTTYVKTLPSLQGPQWEYLTHPGYMSQEESDGETLVIKRPDHRALWESNLFDAIYVAEREKARAKPGLCPRLPPRRIEVVKCPIPTLEHGSGSGRVPIRIALCGVSKSWRHRYPDDFKKYAHLIDMKETNKPDINAFLEQHPESNLHTKDLDGDWDELGSAQIEGEVATASLGATGAGGDAAAFTDGFPVIDYDGDEESGAILETAGILLGDASIGTNSEPKDAFPIDPVLVAGDFLGCENQAPPTLEQDVLRAPVALRVTSMGDLASTDDTRQRSQAALELNGTSHHISHSRDADMPPPPPLGPDPITATGKVASGVEESVVKEKVGHGDLAPGSSSVAAAPAVKRRGRPPGSKNKPKKT